MMSLETIRSLSARRARESARARVQPLVLEAGDSVRGIPFIGSRTPRGWKRVAEHFVDSSGFGSPNEPAMTGDAFQRLVADRPGHGWAITEAGQFQVYVTEFIRTGGAK